MKSFVTKNALDIPIYAIHCSECLCNKDLYPRSDNSSCERKAHYEGCFGGVPTDNIRKQLIIQETNNQIKGEI